MSKATTGEAEVLSLRQSIETQMRRRILEAIELLLEEELTEALGTRAAVKFQIQPDHFGIFGMRDDQGALTDSPAERPVRAAGARRGGR